MGLSSLGVWLAAYIANQLTPLIFEFSETTFGNPSATFFLFSGICVFSFFVGLRLVPETKGKTLEEIARFWMSKREVNRCPIGVDLRGLVRSMKVRVRVIDCRRSFGASTNRGGPGNAPADSIRAPIFLQPRELGVAAPVRCLDVVGPSLALRVPFVVMGDRLGSCTSGLLRRTLVGFCLSFPQFPK